MNSKLLIWVIVSILLCSFVIADLSDDIRNCWSGDDSDVSGATLIDLVGNNNGTITGAVSTTGKINQARNYTNDETALGNMDDLTGNWTVCAWVYVRSCAAANGPGFLANDNWDSDGDFDFGIDTACKPYIDIFNTSFSGNQGGTALPQKVWHLVCAVGNKTGKGIEVYVNTTRQVMEDPTSAVWKDPTFDAAMMGVFNPGGDRFLNGSIDEMYIWTRALSESDITDLYNSGNGVNCSSIVAGINPTTDLTFNALDDFNGSSISSFSVSVSWGNGSYANYSTTNGTIPLINISDSSLTINATYFNISNYFNLTLYDLTVTANVSNTKTANVYQAVVNMEAREKVSNNTISGSTFYVGSLSGSVFNLTAATHIINFTHPNYYDFNGSSFAISALTNTTRTISGVYSSVGNISVYYSNGTVINNWGINITSLTYSNWTGEAGSTTNGSYYFNAINGTYQAVVNSSEGNETFTFTINSAVQNITYYYFGLDNCSSYTDVILNFTILNELTDALLNDSILNIWFNVTSNSIASYRLFNISFSVGNYYTVCVANNTITSWTADAQAEYSNLPSYAEKNYYLVDYPLNATQQDIKLYLTNGTTQVTLSIRDYNDDPITDAYISVLSYDLGTNSYTTTEIVKTDTEGDAFIQIIQNTAWYSFLVEYEGEVIIQTLPTKITTSSLTLRANLETDYFASYDVTQGITSDLTFNNNTGTFSFTFSDPTGGVTQGCLVLTRISINGETHLNSSCATSSAATILVTIPEAFGTNSYKAEGYATISNQNFLLQTETYSYNTTFKTFGLEGIFLSMLLILTLVMVGLWHPVASVVLMVVGVIATNVMGLFYLNWTYIITFIILAVITIYRTGRSE